MVTCCVHRGPQQKVCAYIMQHFECGFLESLETTKNTTQIKFTYCTHCPTLSTHCHPVYNVFLFIHHFFYLFFTIIIIIIIQYIYIFFYSTTLLRGSLVRYQVSKQRKEQRKGLGTQILQSPFLFYDDTRLPLFNGQL